MTLPERLTLKAQNLQPCAIESGHYTTKPPELMLPLRAFFLG